jgi:hypothetical protein
MSAGSSIPSNSFWDPHWFNPDPDPTKNLTADLGAKLVKSECIF